MSFLLFTLSWMIFNSLLALIPVFMGGMMLVIKNTYLKVFFGFLWLIFLPNTIYILTDIKHFPRLMEITSGMERASIFLLFLLFEAVGIFSFIIALYPVEKFLKGKRKSLDTSGKLFLILFNFIIAFGVALGRFQRTNSWEVITNTERVIADVLATVTSHYLLLFIFGFGIISNIIYFYFRESVFTLFIEGKKSDRNFSKRKKIMR